MLDGADAVLRKDAEEEAQNRLNVAARNGGGLATAGVLQPTAVLVSQMSGTKGRLATPTGTPLATPPVSGGLGMNGMASSTAGPKLVLRKPATTSTSFKLKPAKTTALRVNKIATGVDHGFEDVETTQKNIEDRAREEEALRIEEEQFR